MNYLKIKDKTTIYSVIIIIEINKPQNQFSAYLKWISCNQDITRTAGKGKNHVFQSERSVNNAA